MDMFSFEYDVRWKTVKPRCDVYVFKPGELPDYIFPALQVAVLAEPLNYEGLSVTNGAEYIATQLMRQKGIGPFSTAYIEHYPKGLHWKDNPSFDAVSFTWEVVSPGCPVKIRARSPFWRPIPESLYPALLIAMGKEVPEQGRKRDPLRVAIEP